MVAWEKWARQPNQAAGENRTKAVEKIREWLLRTGRPDKTLRIASLGLTSLPELPASLRKLDVYDNQLTSLPKLPASLKRLYAPNNQLASLPKLPASLEVLNVSNNQLTSLPKLPASLKRLYVPNNRLTSLPELPASLGELHVSNNQLTSLPELPPSLPKLYVSRNQLPNLLENITATWERGCDVYVDGKWRSEEALNRLHARAIVNAADYQGSHIHLPSEPALRVPLDSQSDTKPAEQPAASARKTDEPKPEVRFGKKNLQRFHAHHGQADEVGSSWEHGADAASSSWWEPGADAAGSSWWEPGADAAGSSWWEPGADAASSSWWEPGADEARSSWEPGSPQNAGAQANTAAENLGGADAARPARSKLQGTLKILTVFGAMSVGTNFIRHPENERLLREGQRALLEGFGSYIPKDAHCYNARAGTSFLLYLRGIGVRGGYAPGLNRIFLAPYQHPLSGLHVAAHEYCHCFTHPKFNEVLNHGPNKRLELDESLTELISDKVVPSPPPPYGSSYQRAKLPNGKRWMDAAKELEDAVGEATLVRAYFSGDKDAIRKVFSAALNIFPKRVAYYAWDAIKKVDQSYLEEKERMAKKTYKLALNSRNKKAISKAKENFNIPSYRQHLAECFVGASLLEGDQLPPPRNYTSYAHELLPVSDFSQIGFWQKRGIKSQADQARKRLGAVFDQAFYNFDKEAAREAMKAVHEDLQTNWKRILPEMKAHYFAVQD